MKEKQREKPKLTFARQHSYYYLFLFINHHQCALTCTRGHVRVPAHSAYHPAQNQLKTCPLSLLTIC